MSTDLETTVTASVNGALMLPTFVQGWLAYGVCQFCAYDRVSDMMDFLIMRELVYRRDYKYRRYWVLSEAGIHE